MTRTASADLRPYNGPPALRIGRTLLAVQLGAIDGRYYVRDLNGGELLTDDIGAVEVFGVLADAVDFARGTGSLVYHDFPTFDAAVAAAREV